MKISVWLLLAFALVSCGGGSGSSLDPIVIAGKVTFDRVPQKQFGDGLDYNAVRAEPARAVLVRAVRNGLVVATTSTDNQGDYRLETPAGADRVEVLAQSIDDEGESRWNVRVVDGKNSDALYVLRGDLVSTANTPDVRNLHASSGWGGDGYTGVRSAAPFAILDTLFKIKLRFEAESSNIAFPPLVVNWSPQNTTTSSYSPLDTAMEVLGEENHDTDEYDEHVIVHEWWHYFEHEVARVDILGGSHSQLNKLEIRTAYSEGAGNAFAAIILNDPIYRDSGGNRQASGFQFDIESNPLAGSGWFNEGSVQALSYDSIDEANDGADTLRLSFRQLVQALTSESYIQQSSFTSFYSFKQALEDQVVGFKAASDPLWDSSDIVGRGYFGVGETNDAGSDLALPIYKNIAVDASAQEFCTDKQVAGQIKEYNGVGNRTYFRLDVVRSGRYQIEMQALENLNPGAADPDFRVFRNGELVLSALSAGAANENREVGAADLSPGTYIIDAHEYSNVDNILGTGGRFCFDISVTSN